MSRLRDEALDRAGRRASGPIVEADECAAAGAKNGDPWHELKTSVAELARQLGRLAQARKDQAQLAIRERVGRVVRSIATQLVLGLLALIALVYVVHGTALGLAEACGGRLWLGYLLTGTGFLLVAGLTLTVIGRRARARAWRDLQARYGKSEEEADAESSTTEDSNAAQAHA